MYWSICMYEGVSKSFRTESITKYMLTTINIRWEAIQRVMAGKLARLTHKIAIQLHLMAESCTIYSSRSRRPVRKLLNTLSYAYIPDYSLSLDLLFFVTNCEFCHRNLSEGYQGEKKGEKTYFNFYTLRSRPCETANSQRTHLENILLRWSTPFRPCFSSLAEQ
jgi:hypothetical protein